MRKVFKYTLQVASVQQLKLPIGAKVLKVAVQNELLCLWALVNDTAEKELVTFHVFGTGHEIYTDVQYIDSVQMGAFVWHVFRDN